MRKFVRRAAGESLLHNAGMETAQKNTPQNQHWTIFTRMFTDFHFKLLQNDFYSSLVHVLSVKTYLHIQGFLRNKLLLRFDMFEGGINTCWPKKATHFEMWKLWSFQSTSVDFHGLNSVNMSNPTKSLFFRKPWMRRYFLIYKACARNQQKSF